MANKQINRIKVVLVDKQKTNKWLAEQLGKDKTTISKWCTNTSQPDLENLMKQPNFSMQILRNFYELKL